MPSSESSRVAIVQIWRCNELYDAFSSHDSRGHVQRISLDSKSCWSWAPRSPKLTLGQVEELLRIYKYISILILEKYYCSVCQSTKLQCLHTLHSYMKYHKFLFHRYVCIYYIYILYIYTLCVCTHSHLIFPNTQPNVDESLRLGHNASKWPWSRNPKGGRDRRRFAVCPHQIGYLPRMSKQRF